LLKFTVFFKKKTIQFLLATQTVIMSVELFAQLLREVSEKNYSIYTCYSVIMSEWLCAQLERFFEEKKLYTFSA